MASERHEAHAQRALRSFTRRLGEVGPLEPEQAERAAAAVLCALRQRLIPGEGRHLEAQVPVELMELLHTCPFHERQRARDRDGFLDLVAEDLGGGLDPERCARAVFQVVSERLTAGEGAKVVDRLPAELRALWPAAVREAAGADDAPVLDAEPEGEPLPTHEPWDDLRDAARRLPLDAQLGLFQALAGPLLRALDPSARRGLLRGLQQAAEELTGDESALERASPPPA